MYLQQGSHKDRCSATPYVCFYEITWNVIFFNTRLHIIQTFATYHSKADNWTIDAFITYIRIEWHYLDQQ